jgi:hypothetical protein
MKKGNKRPVFCFSFLIFLLLFRVGEGFSQPVSKEERGPQVRLGEITVKFREFESKPSPIKILELRVEIFNRSRNSAVPADSIKVVVVPKEMKLLSAGTTAEFPSDPQEVVLNLPLPPGAGQVVIFGFPFPKEDPDSTTFEIQINPPEGEKKMVTWEKR